MQMRYLYMSDVPFKNFCKLAQHAEKKRKNVWEESNDAFSLSIGVQTTINHMSICFLTQYQSQRKCVFSEPELKARHIDASSVVWTLIDNGKLANQITRLAAIVVTFSSLSRQLIYNAPLKQ